jgi:hypothetical protein
VNTPLDNPTIVIIDVDSGTSLADRQKVAAALTKQVQQHFAPAWGVTATVVGADSSGPGQWRLELRKVPTIDGALGYHDRQADGTPILYVFPELCATDNTPWSSCASHEVLEALADPLLRRCVQLPDGRIAAMEVCDQVESLTYVIDGVVVSDFNLPANFEPEAGKTEQYDYLGKQTTPFQVLDGGYAQVYDSSKGWSQLGAMRAYRAKVAELGLSRGKRRGG